MVIPERDNTKYIEIFPRANTIVSHGTLRQERTRGEALCGIFMSDAV